MRKNRKTNVAKLGLLFVIILIVLASTSISYAMWYKYLYIGGEIETGTWAWNETAWARMYDDPEDFTYDFPGDNWATYIKCTPDETIQTFYLYAAQEYRVGVLNVSKGNNGYLYVEYDLDDGYNMSETHLHVATSLDDIPQNNGNPTPGQFDHKEDHDPRVNEYTYQIQWNSNWNNVDLYIAAHAVVWGIYP